MQCTRFARGTHNCALQPHLAFVHDCVPLSSPHPTPTEPISTTATASFRYCPHTPTPQLNSPLRLDSLSQAELVQWTGCDRGGRHTPRECAAKNGAGAHPQQGGYCYFLTNKNRGILNRSSDCYRDQIWCTASSRQRENSRLSLPPP